MLNAVFTASKVVFPFGKSLLITIVWAKRGYRILFIVLHMRYVFDIGQLIVGNLSNVGFIIIGCLHVALILVRHFLSFNKLVAIVIWHWNMRLHSLFLILNKGRLNFVMFRWPYFQLFLSFVSIVLSLEDVWVCPRFPQISFILNKRVLPCAVLCLKRLVMLKLSINCFKRVHFFC